MAASVPQRCPQCHSPVSERFPHAVMYYCGFSLFNDGQFVTDDYPAECQRRRIKRLEKQLTAARAEAKALRKYIDALEDKNERLRQIEAAARALVDTAFEVTGPDEYIYQAVRLDYFYMLAALLKGEGGASDA